MTPKQIIWQDLRLWSSRVQIGNDSTRRALWTEIIGGWSAWFSPKWGQCANFPSVPWQCWLYNRKTFGPQKACHLFTVYLVQKLSPESGQVNKWKQEEVAISGSPPSHHNHFTALFPGPPGWAGARREPLVSMMQGKINRGRHTDHPD